MRDAGGLNRFDLNLVKVFLAIWDNRSLTAAGQRLCLTQPSVSHALRRLRDAFDDPLFLRVGDRMEPTETASRLYGPFEEALRLLDSTMGAARRFDPAASDRVFRVILSDVGEAVILPRLLALLAAEAPGVSLVSLRVAAPEIEAALRTGRADMAIGYQPVLEGTGCEGRPLLTDRLVCLLRQGHPVLARDWTRDVFAGLGFLDVSRDATGLRMARDVMAELGLDHRIVARLEHFTVLPEVVRRTDLAALFPFSVFSDLPGREAFAMREIPVPIPDYAVKIWVHRLFTGDAGIGWVGTAAQRAMAERA